MQIYRNESAGNFTFSLDDEMQYRFKVAETFLEEMKALVPQKSRTWDSREKIWTIDIGYYTKVRELYNKHFIPKEQTRLAL